MKRKFIVTGIALGLFLNMYAGGLLTNTNQNVAFLRNPARGASTEIDAAYTNPAGLAFLRREGFYLSLNNQSAFQTRTITSDYAPFAGLGGSAVKAFKGEAKALAVPNIQAAYKKGDNWVFSANIGVTGGGGTLDFSKGLPSFETPVAFTPFFMDANPQLPSFSGYDLDSRMKGSSITYGAQFGASYLFHEQYSVYAGFRFNYVNNGYEGHLKDITVGMGGNMVPAAALINNPNFAQLQPLLSRFLAERALDCKQTGSGIAPILGFHYNWDELNIGVKYEFKTRLDLKNKTEINTTGIDDYNNGAIIPYDIPALFTLGASYEITPEFTLSAGYHHFFDSNAKMINDKQKYINGGINEFLAGAEYRINDMFLISCGTQFTRTGVTDDYQTDLSFSLNSYSVGFGGAINLSRRIRLNLAYFFTNYEDWTKKSADYGNISGRAALLGAQLPSVSGSDTFGRTNRAFGIGLDYRF